MTLYLSATYARQAAMREIRQRIHAETRHRVVASWLDQIGPAKLGPVPGQRVARQDIRDLLDASLLMLDGLEPSPTGGKHFEHGYMCALGRPVGIVGPVESVFGHLADFEWPSWDEAIAWLRSGSTAQEIA